MQVAKTPLFCQPPLGWELDLQAKDISWQVYLHQHLGLLVSSLAHCDHQKALPTRRIWDGEGQEGKRRCVQGMKEGRN